MAMLASHLHIYYHIVTCCTYPSTYIDVITTYLNVCKHEHEGHHACISNYKHYRNYHKTTHTKITRKIALLYFTTLP